ncbi:MAG: right-handed parallel beta-helix repeat-containing protein [Thermoplasmata archaeon]|nr:MAG: right-handed parallel beta-helix repeat-containing protein [Thermoplasmata archaeon]
MRKRLISIIIVGLILSGGLLYLLHFSYPIVGGTDVGGIISADTTWTLAGSPYYVVSDVYVVDGVNLFIEPGVQVKFNGYYSIYVNGSLFAVGTKAKRIEITSNMTTAAPDDWNKIQINSTGYTEIKYCNISYGNLGIFLYMTPNNIITHNYISSNEQAGIALSSSSDNSINNNTISPNNGNGIYLLNSPNNHILDNNVISNNGNGIFIDISSNNTVINNNVSDNLRGIYLLSSTYNTVRYNNITLSENEGISFSSASDNNINDNNITNNYLGMSLIRSSNNTIGYNNISHNDGAIGLSQSSNNNTVISNTIINNSAGIGIFGGNIKSNRMVLNKIFGNGGGVGIVINDPSMPGPGSYGSVDHIILYNIICNNYIGIDLSVMDSGAIGVDILSSNIYDNEIGIDFEEAGGGIQTTIINCTIEYNDIGIKMFQINNLNNIVGNNISYNRDYAMYLERSRNIQVYHNNFIKNGITEQAYDDSDSNLWNDSYPSSGNFWSDYYGLDRYKGPEQNIPGNDGIGDSPYNIDMDSQDNYPLMFPIGPSMFLYQGWNLISIPFIQPDMNFGEVLSPISGSFDAAQWYNTTDDYDHWEHNSTSKPPHLNDLDALDHTMGFWIHVTEPRGVLFEYLGEEPTQDQNISLNVGWNMVGYPSFMNYNRTDGLSNLNFGTDVDAIWSFNAGAQMWEYIRDIDFFFNRKGYYLHSKVNEIWEVPL